MHRSTVATNSFFFVPKRRNRYGCEIPAARGDVARSRCRAARPARMPSVRPRAPPRAAPPPSVVLSSTMVCE